MIHPLNQLFDIGVFVLISGEKAAMAGVRIPLCGPDPAYGGDPNLMGLHDLNRAVWQISNEDAINCTMMSFRNLSMEKLISEINYEAPKIITELLKWNYNKIYLGSDYYIGWAKVAKHLNLEDYEVFTSISDTKYSPRAIRASILLCRHQDYLRK